MAEEIEALHRIPAPALPEHLGNRNVEPSIPRRNDTDRPASFAELRELVEIAVNRTLDGDRPQLERSPVPVRYRASGAIEAWSQLRSAAGPNGRDFSRVLRNFHGARNLSELSPVAHAYRDWNLGTSGGSTSHAAERDLAGVQRTRRSAV